MAGLQRRRVEGEEGGVVGLMNVYRDMSTTNRMCLCAVFGLGVMRVKVFLVHEKES